MEHVTLTLRGDVLAVADAAAKRHFERTGKMPSYLVLDQAAADALRLRARDVAEAFGLEGAGMAGLLEYNGMTIVVVGEDAVMLTGASNG